MFDPTLALAFAAHTTKNAYALLLGSGISRPAAIPTGWDVVLDLIRKLASLQKADCEPDPADWYVRTYGADPDYADLLNRLASTPAARQQLLRAYFEPTDEEREQGLKQPTAAHRAIADLVARGAIRVIITTNFDRLLEQALHAVGVTPTVISTTDSVHGALPIHLTPCTIIKLHGDYGDTRIKNTADELTSYDPPMDALLDRVLDEHGLIICGWSGQWDTALLAALQRCSSHRFSTFWMAKDGNVGDRAQQIVTQRRATVIPIDSADAAFQKLAEQIDALDTFDRPHPLSTAMAVQTLKKYLVDDRYRIQLHDLMVDQTSRLRQALFDPQFTIDLTFATDEDANKEVVRRVTLYEGLAEPLQTLLVTGCYWGTAAHHADWVRCIEQVAVLPPYSGQHYMLWLNLQRYPATLLLYAGGMAALAAGHYDTLAALLTKPSIKDNEVFEQRPAVLTLAADTIMNHEQGHRLHGRAVYTPISNRLHPIIQTLLREFIPDDQRFMALFDRFEYLLGLVHTDVQEQVAQYFWGPSGQFGWRYRGNKDKGPSAAVAAEVEAEGQNWPPLQVGLFRGDLARLKEVKAAFDEEVSRFRWR